MVTSQQMHNSPKMSIASAAEFLGVSTQAIHKQPQKVWGKSNEGFGKYKCTNIVRLSLII